MHQTLGVVYRGVYIRSTFFLAFTVSGGYPRLLKRGFRNKTRTRNGRNLARRGVPMVEQMRGRGAREAGTALVAVAWSSSIPPSGKWNEARGYPITGDLIVNTTHDGRQKITNYPVFIVEFGPDYYAPPKYREARKNVLLY